MPGYGRSNARHDGGQAVANGRYHLELYQDMFGQVRIDVSYAGSAESPMAILKCTKFPAGWRLSPVPEHLPANVGTEARKLMATLP
jgi:hypothetical protein